MSKIDIQQIQHLPSLPQMPPIMRGQELKPAPEAHLKPGRADQERSLYPGEIEAIRGRHQVPNLTLDAQEFRNRGPRDRSPSARHKRPARGS